MSYEFLRSAWNDNQTKGNARLALLSLADQANDDGICWPSKKNLNHRLNCSKRTADEAVAELLRMGLVEGYSGTKRNGRNTSNHYIMKAWLTAEQYEKALEKVKDILGKSMQIIEPTEKQVRELTEEDKIRMGADRCTPMVQTVAPSYGADRCTPMVQTVAPDPPIDHSQITQGNNHFPDSGESGALDGDSPFQEKENNQPEEKATTRKDVGEPEMRPLDTPFGIFQRLAEIDSSIAGKRGQVLRDAKDLLNGNDDRCIPAYSPEDILNCAKFVVQDPWRIKNLVPLTSQVLVEKLPKWVEAKRPKTWNEWESSQTSTQNGVAKFHRDRTHELVTEEKFG